VCCWEKLNKCSIIDDKESSEYSTAPKVHGRSNVLGAGVAVIGNIDRWYADMYGAMSMAYRLSAAIKDRATAVKVAFRLRHLDSVLTRMFKDIHASIDRNPKPEAVNPEQVQEAMQLLEKLQSILARLLHVCKVARLTNNSLMAQSLHNIANWNEEVAELIEVMQLSLNREAIDFLYKRSKEERERGEIFDLSEV
jgi:hypothetical protein